MDSNGGNWAFIATLYSFPSAAGAAAVEEAGALAAGALLLDVDDWPPHAAKILAAAKAKPKPRN